MAILVRCVVLLALSIPGAHAAIVEEIVKLPVAARDRFGVQNHHTITVTVIRDDERIKTPFMLINHGRSGAPEQRARFGRARYAANSQYFVERGFAVFIPTRMGYGVSGGEDVEDTGPCANRDFHAGFEAAAAQSLTVIEYARSRNYVDSSRGVLVGQSYGGATTVALAAKNIDGVLAAINFAGGSGGSSIQRPREPCSEAALASVYGDYGKTTRIPVLWLYSENDMYWGREYPRQWHERFRAAGGIGEFVQLPAYGLDGHGSFGNNPSEWKPHVERFLKQHGLWH